MGVVASDEPSTASAARFTSNARVGAPVIVSRDAALDRLRAVAANSGYSNVGDGQRGDRHGGRDAAGRRRGARRGGGSGGGGLDGRDRRGAAARHRGDGRARGLAARSVRTRGDFSEAILTSDRGPKRACLEVALDAGAVRLGAQAKGAGMISPRFATMFCFVQTDAAIEPSTLDLSPACA